MRPAFVKRSVTILESLLLTLLFVGYYGGTTLFYHVHAEPDGLIVHSHPVWHHEANAPTHHHSRAAYQTIQQLSHILLILFVADLLLRICRTSYPPLLCPPPYRIAEVGERWIPRRAPPVR